MNTAAVRPRVTSLAPQFLVRDLARSMAYYRRLGFEFGQPWGGFYAIGWIDGLELHLKEAPRDEKEAATNEAATNEAATNEAATNEAERRHRRENEHLDASAGVDGIEAFYETCVANGATVLRPLAPTEWGTKDFYVEDPDGYILCFGGTAR